MWAYLKAELVRYVWMPSRHITGIRGVVWYGDRAWFRLVQERADDWGG